MKGSRTPINVNYGRKDERNDSMELKENEPFHLRSVTGSLLWLANAMRHDIAYVVNRVSSLIQKSWRSTYAAAWRILRYVTITPDFGLEFIKLGGTTAK